MDLKHNGHGDQQVSSEADKRHPDEFEALKHFFFALCCLGKIPGGAPFSQLHKSGNGSRVDRP